MKIKFLKDFGDFKEGQVYDLPPAEADEHLEAGGRAEKFYDVKESEPVKPVKKSK